MHLLDEEVLNQQPYLGEQEDAAPVEPKKEEDLQKEMKKYMNIDFNFDETEFDDGQSGEGESGDSKKSFNSSEKDERLAENETMPEEQQVPNSLQQLEML